MSQESGELEEVPVTFYGWRARAIDEIKTSIPLAIKMERMQWNRVYYRTDIGYGAAAREG